MSGFRVLVFALALSCLGTSSAQALDKIQAYWLQHVLNDHGFYVGDPDGVIGPKSKEKILEFATVYGAPKAPELLFSWIIQQSAMSSETIEDEGILQEIRAKVAEQLKDPASAQFRKIRLQKGPSGDFVCGEVNGKNSYGAYAGYTPFFSLGAFSGHFAMFYIDSESHTVAFYKCLTSFPKLPIENAPPPH